MEVIRYENKYLESWEDFVALSNNGTIFHTRKFLSYHPPDRFKDCSLIFREGNSITALLTACLVVSDEKQTLVSHKGASFGGFVHRKDLSLKQAFDLTETLSRLLFSERDIQNCYNSIPCHLSENLQQLH